MGKLKNIAIVLCFIVLSSSAEAIVKPEAFTDVGINHWAFSEIKEMAAEGIISGYLDGSFRPDEEVTCGEFIKMAVNLLSESVDAVPESHWARPYYDAGIQLSLFNAYDISPKVLDRPIKRSLMAVISGSMPEQGRNVVIPSSEYSKCLESIKDVNSRTPYENFIVKSYSLGVLTGYPDGTFRPNATLKRAEAALVIYRLKENLPVRLAAEGEVTKEENGIFPEGTITLKVVDCEKNKDIKHKGLRLLLFEQEPLIGDEIYSALLDFEKKPLGPGRQGMRKQYFGDVPVLMERLDDTLRIFILPAGYDNRFWQTRQGEINEEFF